MLLKHCKARPRFFACRLDKAFEFFHPKSAAVRRSDDHTLIFSDPNRVFQQIFIILCRAESMLFRSRK